MRSPSPLLRQTRPIRRRRINLGIRILRAALKAATAMAVPAAIAWWLLGSGQFELTQIASAGTQRVDPEWIQEVLQEELGSNLLLVRLDAVEQRVLTHPWSAKVRSSKELPDRLLVEVEDRSIAAVLDDGKNRVFVDESGSRIALVEGAEVVPPDVLQLESLSLREGESEADLVKSAFEVDRILRSEAPDFRSQITKVEIMGAGAFRLHSDAVPFPVRVSMDGLGARMRAFEELAPEISRRFEEIEEVDLRIDGRIVVRPRGRELATAI